MKKTIRQRFAPNARVKQGAEGVPERLHGRAVRTLGDPFQLELPRPPGGPPPITWLACVFPDCKVRPVPGTELERI